LTDRINVNGILNDGGDISITGSAIGDHPVVNNFPAGQEQRPGQRHGGKCWDVGVITILSEETQAVSLALRPREVQVGSLHFHEAELNPDAKPIKVVAVQALTPGQHSAIAAYENLRQHYDPRVVVLVGIGGGIHRDVRLGDVVVATRVVYYDLRKETASGIIHRGQEREAPAEIGHAINSFFTDHDPAEFSVEDPGGRTRVMRMRTGPIGSGDAVIADHRAKIRAYLASFNDKILAVDMEAGGLSQACHEQSATSGRPHGWAVIRGISDDAGSGKNDDYHHIASWHAAIALRKLLPYLRVGPSS